MSLKNCFHTKLAIGILISDEETLDAKLNLLTEIGLSATNRETFEICEEFRERLCGEEVAQGRKVLLRDSEAKRIYKSNPRKEESHAMDEGK